MNLEMPIFHTKESISCDEQKKIFETFKAYHLKDFELALTQVILGERASLSLNSLKEEFNQLSPEEKTILQIETFEIIHNLSSHFFAQKYTETNRHNKDIYAMRIEAIYGYMEDTLHVLDLDIEQAIPVG